MVRRKRMGHGAVDPKADPAGVAVAQALARAYQQGVAALRKTGAPFAVIGGVALDAYDAPRVTTDIDFMLFCPPELWDDLPDRLRGLRYDQIWAHRNPSALSLVRRFHVGKIPVDVLRPRDAHERELEERLIGVRLLGRAVHVLAPEDYILLKAKASRPRDLDDAVRVAVTYLDRIDYARLRRWSLRLGVFEEVQYIVARAESDG